MLQISLLSPPAMYTEACGHSGWALCGILHLFNWQNNNNNSNIFCNFNSAKIHFFEILHSAKCTFPHLLVLCDTWNWSHDNDIVSGLEYQDTVTIPEVHMKH